mmetsp:Transcript_16838/g.25465  ORF Transcript_16838/g.25465 Transcript_16838/m.25465 type:complete len:457 (+) Transcript_16838:278-1648(+)
MIPSMKPLEEDRAMIQDLEASLSLTDLQFDSFKAPNKKETAAQKPTAKNGSKISLTELVPKAAAARAGSSMSLQDFQNDEPDKLVKEKVKKKKKKKKRTPNDSPTGRLKKQVSFLCDAKQEQGNVGSINGNANKGTSIQAIRNKDLFEDEIDTFNNNMSAVGNATLSSNLWEAATKEFHVAESKENDSVKKPQHQSLWTKAAGSANSSTKSNHAAGLWKNAAKAIVATNALQKQVQEEIEKKDEEGYELHDDVYSMMFLANSLSASFCFSWFVFVFKLLLYLLLFSELDFKTNEEQVPFTVKSVQFLMMPIAIAIQEDLIESFALIANIQYDKKIQDACPGATEWKWVMASGCRFLDGLISLIVNFILLLQATDALSLFLNFAALQFLQAIDNIFFTLALQGFILESIEFTAKQATVLKLPRREYPKFLTKMDSILFVFFLVVMLAVWVVLVAAKK